MTIARLRRDQGKRHQAHDLLALSLLKNLSGHRGRSSATATVGDARKFVRSRNPVTVIIEIESRDLDRAPDMDCPTQWVKGTDIAGAMARFDDRCVLRLRDVRTPQAGISAVEARRGCRPGRPSPSLWAP